MSGLDQWVTVDLAADYSKRPPWTIRTWIRNGELTTQRRGRALHVNLAAAMQLARVKPVDLQRRKNNREAV